MPDFTAINRAALSSAETLLRQWIPGGKRLGREYVALNPRRHDRRPGSFTINLHTGQWADFASGDKGGDLISLYAYLHGVSQGEAARALGMGNDTAISPLRAPKPPKPPKEEPAAPHPIALRLWRESIPARGTATETYLRGRGIACPILETIRHLPRGWHKPSNTHWPCMLAAVTRWPDNAPVAVHRTYLAPDGSGKAPVEPDKMMLGGTAGGAVRIGDCLDSIVIAEGLETALSVFQATGMTVWAALSTSGIRGLILPPPGITPHVTIAADHDEPGIDAAHDAAERLSNEGYRVRLAIPSIPGADFNDLLREAGA